MRKFLGTLVMFAIVIGVVGASRNWFSVERNREGTDTNLHLRIDRDKIKSDTTSAAEIAKELGENLEQKIEKR